jgi:hypothetical protein
MSMFIRRKAVIPVWVILFGLLALYMSPLTVGTGALLLLGAIVVPAIVLILWQEPEPVPTRR